MCAKVNLPSTSDSTGLKTMQINDQKAGMEGLDKKMINNIIYEASKGTSYFHFQEKRQKRIDQKVKEMQQNLLKFSDEQKKEAMEKMTALGAAIESERDLGHSIVHIDMDAFYAAVEMRDNPELKLKPMAVGSLSMLSTSNYHARKYGVRAAMPGFIARKLCPDLCIVPCNFEKYRKDSDRIRNVVKDYDPNFLPVGLDEVYLDLTHYIWKKHKEKLHAEHFEVSSNSSDEDDMVDICVGLASSKCKLCQNDCRPLRDEDRDAMAYTIVQEIREQIEMATQLTASAGIAPNTMLAKVCSDQNKPNGQFQIQSSAEEIKKFISTLPIKKVSGIGPVQAQILNALGIQTCTDLWNKRDLLELLFSQTSVHFYIRVALGIGSTSTKSDHTRKSIGGEETFKEIYCPEDLHQKCEEISEDTAEDLRSRNLVGKVVMLKIKTVNFDVRTRHLTLPVPTSDKEIIAKAARKLLDAEISMAAPEPLRLRLMGVRMSGLCDGSHGSTCAKQQQGKLIDFLKEKHELPQSSKFVCPVCNKELQVDLSTFNSHIDECLKTENEDQLIRHDNDSSSDLHIPVSENANLTTCSASVMPSSDPEASAFDIEQHEVEGTSDFVLSDEAVSGNMHCPVCGLKQKISTLSQLNEHIDNCLSQSTIREMLSTQTPKPKSSQSEKRKVTSTKDSQSKKLKNVNTCKKIDDYFHL